MKIKIWYLANLSKGWWIQVIAEDGSAVTASQSISREYAKLLFSRKIWKSTSETFCKRKIRGFISQ